MFTADKPMVRARILWARARTWRSSTCRPARRSAERAVRRRDRLEPAHRNLLYLVTRSSPTPGVNFTYYAPRVPLPNRATTTSSRRCRLPTCAVGRVNGARRHAPSRPTSSTCRRRDAQAQRRHDADHRDRPRETPDRADPASRGAPKPSTRRLTPLPRIEPLRCVRRAARSPRSIRTARPPTSTRFASARAACRSWHRAGGWRDRLRHGQGAVPVQRGQRIWLRVVSQSNSVGVSSKNRLTILEPAVTTREPY